MERTNWVEDQKYQTLINKKVNEVEQGDFYYFFELFCRKLNDYDTKQIEAMDSLLTYFGLICELRKELVEEKLALLFQTITSSSVYAKYKENEVCFKYPLCEDSLYKLELDYVSFLKNENRTLKQYVFLLEVLSHLLLSVTNTTIYIVHNMLLYYKYLKEEKIELLEYEQELSNCYREISDSEVYQKLKK